MSNANQMDLKPKRGPTGPKKPEEIRLPTEEELKRGLLDTIAEPKNTLPFSEFAVVKFMQGIKAKLSEILERKADILAKLEKITDYETLLQRLDSYFTEMTEAINNLVSEIEENEQIPQMLGVEAVEELIEDIKNLLCLDPKKDGDLINRLQILPKIYLKNHIERCQLALILEGGNNLEKFRERVQTAIKRNNYEELTGLVREISALEIMQVYPSSSSPILSEREAYKLKAEYDKLRRIAYYQAILISEGGNNLEKFRERVQTAIKRDERDNYEELTGLIQEISALEIMQVHPFSSSPLPQEIEAYELKAEYDKLRRIANYQAILISEGGKKLEQFRERVQAAIESNNYKELKGLVEKILALKIMLFYPSSSSSFLPEREAYELKAEYDELKLIAYYQAVLILDGGEKLEQFRERVQAALGSNNYKELEGLIQEISALEIMQVYINPSSSLPPEEKAYKLKTEYQRMIEMIKEAQKELRKLRSST